MSGTMTALELPTYETLLLRRDGWRLHVTLNRPQVRNAMNGLMIDELLDLLATLADRGEVRALILRGAGGNFCAGGDIEDMVRARAAAAGPDGVDALVVVNRRFGHLMQALDRTPRAVVAVLEGAVMGGGLGLACVADVTLSRVDAVFRLPETGLGLPPAQIAPFVARRVGLTHARRLAITGGRFDGTRALALGIAHATFEDDDALTRTLAELLEEIGRCAPGAVATTKALMLDVGEVPLATLLDRGAEAFAAAVRGPEGTEGMAAFLRKTPPRWAKE